MKLTGRILPTPLFNSHRQKERKRGKLLEFLCYLRIGGNNLIFQSSMMLGTQALSSPPHPTATAHACCLHHETSLLKLLYKDKMTVVCPEAVIHQERLKMDMLVYLTAQFFCKAHRAPSTCFSLAPLVHSTVREMEK